MVAEHSTDLLTGGLTASAIARQAHLPEHVVRQGMQEIAKSDPELRFARKDGEFLLFRGAPVDAAEPASIGMIERIKRLLSGEGNEAAKINVLAGQNQ
jgi:hypothetical protein